LIDAVEVPEEIFRVFFAAAGEERRGVLTVEVDFDLAAARRDISDLTNETGVWTLRFLCITLALTPLRRMTGWNGAVRFRRMAGLFAFFYGTLHFLTYVIADRFAGLDFPDGIVAWSTVRNLLKSVGDDIYKRPFITVGFTAWSTMVPLALTSTAGSIRRLGGRRWNLLHRLVYLTAVLGPVHYWWLVKSDVRRPIIYGIVVALLLGFRVVWARTHANPVRRQELAAARKF
jgi:sulfoxide reductase heme-binding subunit YedZ